MVPFALKKIDHVVLRIRDLDKSLVFYCDVIGCEIEKRQEAIGLIQVRAGASLIDLVPVDRPLGQLGGAPPAREGRNVDHFAIQVASFDEAMIRAHLEQHGVEVLESGMRYGAEGTGPSIYIKDPDGNTVELKGPAFSPPERGT
jgi:glyoxylase I family protein